MAEAIGSREIGDEASEHKSALTAGIVTAEIAHKLQSEGYAIVDGAVPAELLERMRRDVGLMDTTDGCLKPTVPLNDLSLLRACLTVLLQCR